MDPAGTLGELIRTARERAGRTQVWLSAALDVDQATVSRWESDRTRPDARTLARLARVLDLDAERILALAMQKRRGAA